jgi:hypothetical protein
MEEDRTAEARDEVSDEELDEVSGGVEFVYAKPEVVYVPQKPDGTL